MYQQRVEITAGKSFGLTEILLLGVPPLLGGYLAEYFGYDMLLGVFAGVAAGVFLVYRRLKR